MLYLTEKKSKIIFFLSISIILNMVMIDIANCQIKTELLIDNADTSYLSNIKANLNKKWPDNHSINLIFHGHSVPSGYQNTPIITTFGSYPLLALKLITQKYPFAVVNVIKTSIGGENSEQGAKRFKKEVLIYKPDVLFIDYALNDRPIGLERAKKAWEKMIKLALKQHIKLVLLTPTPDLKENIKDPNAPLAKHALQILTLGSKYNIPVVNSYQAFKNLASSGVNLKDYMAQNNHINLRGHEIVANLIFELFN